MASTEGHGPTAGRFKGALYGGKIWWVAPDYATASEEIWPALKRSLRGAAVRLSESERSITLPGGGMVTVRSADNPGSLVGSGLDGLVLDEAGKVHKDAWHQSLRPTLADKQGWSIFIGTPKGHNWFYELFERAKTDAGWEAWQRPSNDNPLVRPEEMEAMRKEMIFREYSQEILAQFTAIEDAALELEDIDAATVLTEPANPDGGYDLFGAAIDLGLKNDHSALVVLGLTNDMKYFDLAACVSWKPEPGGQVSLEDVKRGVLQARSRFGVNAVVYDPWQAELMAEQLRSEGLRMIPFTFSPKNLDIMATTLVRVFKNRTIRIYPEADLRRDLSHLTIAQRAAGFRLDGIRDEHGHCDRAFALATLLPHMEITAKDGVREMQPQYGEVFA